MKFNNHPAPPKVGVTAAESGTYTDFANINLGGLLADGSDGSNELSHLLLDVIDEMHLLQPSSQPAALAQDARRRPEARAARGPQGLRLPLALQRRRRGRGAAAAGQDARGRAGRRLLRLRRGGGLRQGGLRPHRLLQPAEGAGAGPPRRRRPAHRHAAGPVHGRAGGPRVVRRRLRRLRGAAAPLPRREDRGQRADRPDVRAAHAGAVSLRAHRRLHPQRPGLQRRRRPLQQHLHPGRRASAASPTRSPPSAPWSSRRSASAWPTSSARSTPTSPGTRSCGSGSSTGRRSTATTTTAPTRSCGARSRPSSRRWTAAPARAAGPTASRCCRPPATSTSAR